MTADDYLIKVAVTQQGIQARAEALGHFKAAVKKFEQQVSFSRGTVSFRTGGGEVQRAVDFQMRMAREANRVVGEKLAEVAIATQEDVARRLKNDIKNPTASTGMLESFTRSRENRTTTMTWFGVGNLEAMESSQKVRYALAIEAGSTAAVGRRLVGFWEGPGGISGFGPHTDGDVFQHVRSEVAREALRSAGLEGSPISGVVKRPIEAHRDYRKAVFYGKPQLKMAQAIRKAYGFE